MGCACCRSGKKNAVPPGHDSIEAGKKIFFKRCAACHGKEGNGDGPNAVDLGIHPAKLSDPRMREESDGALFLEDYNREEADAALRRTIVRSGPVERHQLHPDSRQIAADRKIKKYFHHFVAQLVPLFILFVFCASPLLADATPAPQK